MKPLLPQLFAAGLALVAVFTSAQSTVWTGSWAAAPMSAPASDTNLSEEGTTFRNFVHLSIGGNAIRIRLSNEYGTRPLTIAEVHVASSTGQGTIASESDHLVTFGGVSAVEFPQGPSLSAIQCPWLSQRLRTSLSASSCPHRQI